MRMFYIWVKWERIESGDLRFVETLRRSILLNPARKPIIQTSFQMPLLGATLRGSKHSARPSYYNNRASANHTPLSCRQDKNDYSEGNGEKKIDPGGNIHLGSTFIALEEFTYGSDTPMARIR